MTTMTRVEQDDPCTQCGYNLRGLQLDDHCPECGESVADSVRGDGWESAPVAWAATLRGGAQNLRRGVLTMPFFVYPGVFLAVLGVFALTAKRPGDDEAWMVWNKRLLARWVTVVGGLSMVGFGAYVLLVVVLSVMNLSIGGDRAEDILWGRSSRAGSWMTLDAWLIGTHVAFVMGCIMLCEYIRALGGQVPDGALVAATTRLWRRTAVLLFGLGLMGGFTEVAWWFDGLKGYHVPLAGTMVWTVLGFVIVLGLIAWWWWGLLRWAGYLSSRLKPRG